METLLVAGKVQVFLHARVVGIIDVDLIKPFDEDFRHRLSAHMRQ